MKRFDLNKGWEFYENEEGMGFQFEKKTGVKINLPHDFIINKPRAADAAGGAGNGYFGNGQGVYRKELEVPADWKGKSILLDVDGAYMNAEVMLNQELLYLHPYGYTPFLVELTDALRFDGGRNRLKIVTQSRQPSSRWYSGGGLYRSVCLWVGNPVHIRPWDIFVTTEQADGAKARVHMAVKITNRSGQEREIEVRGQLLDAVGAIRAEQSSRMVLPADGLETEFTYEVVNPRLWQLSDPYLYTYRVEIRTEGEIQDVAEDSFGIRTISADVENGFRLNGEALKLKGGCLHHDNGFLGACAYPKAEERKIRLLRSVGYNAVRISHYPPSLELLRICDRLGMLVLDECFDVWRLSKVPMDYHLYFEDWWERDIEAMVLRDRNHPCVITYSIGNEIGERDGGSGGACWSAKLTEKVRSLDNTRFVLSALCGVFPDPEEGGSNFEANLDAGNAENDIWADATEEFVKPLDIVGYNYLFQRYEKDHERYPKRLMMGTETHSFTTYDNWQAVMKHPYVLGDFIWAAVDYLGEVGVGKVYWEKDNEPFQFMTPYPWRTSWQSDFDLTGEQRPQSRFREIMWGREDKSALYTTHPKHFGEGCRGTGWHWDDVNDSWTFEEEWIGSRVKADVYGAGDEAEFILNGRSLGKAPFDKLIATMDIPYEKGLLEAVVTRDGREISRCSLKTAGGAAKLGFRPEEETLRANSRDLCFIHVDVTDAEGNRLPQDERRLVCKVEGPGELLAVGSGSPCTEDPIGENWCHAYHGTAVVILKACAPGAVTVTVEADGIPAGKATVMAEE